MMEQRTQALILIRSVYPTQSVRTILTEVEADCIELCNFTMAGENKPKSSPWPFCEQNDRVENHEYSIKSSLARKMQPEFIIS